MNDISDSIIKGHISPSASRDCLMLLSGLPCDVVLDAIVRHTDGLFNRTVLYDLVDSMNLLLVVRRE